MTHLAHVALFLATTGGCWFALRAMGKVLDQEADRIKTRNEALFARLDLPFTAQEKHR